MALEISASRFLAPYFGASLFVWTNVIGIVLLALSLGYYAGGRLSEKAPTVKTLFKIIAFSGALISVIPYLGRPLSRLIIEQILSAPASFLSFIGSFFAALFLFALPVAMLGAISPFLIKIAGSERNDIGKVSGTLFAVGTLGSMVGTFVPTLVLIPFLGTKMTISICGAILLALGALGLIGGKLKFAAILPFILPFTYDVKDMPGGLLYETESPYQYIRVYERADGGRELRFNEGLGIQSLWTPSGYVGKGYWDYPTALFSLREDFPKRAAILGLAAGTISRSAALQYPEREFAIDGMEIDSKVIEIAKKFFDLDRPNLNVYNADARNFMAYANNLYDLIFVDAYSNQLYIPPHLASKEFFGLVKSRLNKDGAVIMNVNAVSYSSPLLRAIANTLASQFQYVEIISVPESYNFLVLGSNTPLDLPAAAKRLPKKFADIGDALVNRSKRWEFSKNERVFTDDKAPIELMTDALFFELLGQELKRL